MATRKKKSESMTLAMPGTMGSAKLSFPNEPTVTVGNHLTVTTYPDGRTELKWDDAALEREVREAIAAYELGQLKPAVLAKTTRKKKVQK